MLPRYCKLPTESKRDWRLYVGLAISLLLHGLAYWLTVRHEDKYSAIQSNQTRPGIVVTLSAAPKAKPSPQAKATPKPAQPPKPSPPPSVQAKPRPVNPPTKPPTREAKPLPSQPRLPRPIPPPPPPAQPKPHRPTANPKPKARDEPEVPEYKDDFAELSKDYRQEPPATTGMATLGAAAAALSEQGIRPGSILNINPRIQYPIQAMRQGMRGVVAVLIHIATDGTVDDVELQQSSGYDVLDDAVLGAVQHWHFKPPTKNGIPVAGVYRHRVFFGVDGAVTDDFDLHWREVQLLPADP